MLDLLTGKWGSATKPQNQAHTQSDKSASLATVFCTSAQIFHLLMFTSVRLTLPTAQDWGELLLTSLRLPLVI